MKTATVAVALTATLLFAAVTQAQTTTPVQWSGNGHWFEVISTGGTMNWSQARQAAQDRGGCLACITSAEENSFILNTLPLPGQGAFIGGYAVGDGTVLSNWRWVSGEPWVYHNWNPSENEPNHAEETSTEFYTLNSGGTREPGRWNNVAPSHVSGEFASYVVEYDFGNSRCFNGTDDYVLVPDDPSLNVTSKLTIEARIKLAELPSVSEYAIASKWAGTGGAGGRYMLGVDGGSSAGKLILNLPYDVAYSTQVLSPDQWYHVAASYDGSSIRLYINGQLDNTVPAAGGLGSSATPLAIGKNLHNNLDPSVAPYYFKGLIDEVRISDVARTPGSFCLTAPCTPDANTMALWHLDEGSGTTVHDATGNHNDGVAWGSGCTPPPIPTFSVWGAIIFGVLLLGSVVFYIWRRRRVAVA